MIKNKYIVNILYNVFRRITSLVMPLLAFTYSARVLSVEGFGAISFTKSIIEIFVVIASLGVRAYGIRELSPIRYTNERGIFVNMVFTVNILSAVLTTFVLLMLLIVNKAFVYYRVALLIQVPIIFFSQLGSEWIYESYENYKFISVRNVCIQLTAFVGVLIFVKNENDYLKYILVWTLAECICGTINFVGLKKYVNIRLVSVSCAKDVLKPILLLFAFSMTNSIYCNIDTGMLGIMKSAYDVGIYDAGIKVTKVVTLVITAMGGVFLSKYASMAKHRYGKNASDITAFLICLMLVVALPSMTGVGMLRKDIISLFCGDKYINSERILSITLGLLIMTPIFTFINTNIFVAYNKEKYLYYSVGVALITNVLLNLLFVPLYGVNGAALATVLAELIGVGIAIFLSNKVFAYWKKMFYYKKILLGSILGCLGVSCYIKIVKVILFKPYQIILISIIGSMFIYSIVVFLCSKSSLKEITSTFEQ